MATFLDISILGHFVGIFTFLLVFVIIYGMMELFNIFGEGRRGLHAIIAVSIGFIVLFSTGVVRVIQTFTPWFVMMILIIFFILFAVRMFGLKEKNILEGFYNNPAITSWIIIMTVIILLFSLGTGFGQTSLDQRIGGAMPTNNSTTVTATNTSVTPGATNTDSFTQNLYNTLYHPKVLGMILIFLIVVIAMLLLTSRESS